MSKHIVLERLGTILTPIKYLLDKLEANKVDKSELDEFSEILNSKVNKEELNEAVANLVNSAPATLDTLGELATALQENEDVVETLNKTVANKVSKTELTNATKVKMDQANPTGTGSFSLNRDSNSVIGSYSVAAGKDTIASGHFSHANGYDTHASGQAAHAEGWITSASGEAAHSEGGVTHASGDRSHAEGSSTWAKGLASHAEGKETTASGDYQHVQGKFNIEDTLNNYAHIVGNGESDTTCSNAHTLDWDGNAWFSGDVYVGSTSGTNKDEGSKKLLTEDDIKNTIEVKKEKDLIVTYQKGSVYYATHTVDEILEAVNNGRTVYFQKDSELLNLLEINTSYATFYIVYLNMQNKLQQKVLALSGNSIILEQDDTYDFATKSDLNLYYLKTEVDKKIADLVNSAPETLDTLGELATALQENEEIVGVINQAITEKANADVVLTKTEQTLTDEELTQVRSNLKFIGKDVAGQTFTINGTEVTASANAEIFGDYENNIAVGQWSIAEGSGTVAKGRASHAEGAFSKALSDGSHVEGYQTEATGYWSHAEGEMTKVTSYASHAEGSYCTLPDGTKRYGTAAGYASHIEGGGCHATGSCSHAEGLATTVSGAQSHAEGRYTIASGGAQHVEGIGNIEDAAGNYIHIAGNGSFAERSNAYTLAWDGTAWFAGDVYVGSADGKNKDEGSVKLISTSDLRGAKLELEEYVNEELAQKSIVRKEGAVVQNYCEENRGISIISKFGVEQEGSGTPYPAGGGKNKAKLYTPQTKTNEGVTTVINADGSVSVSGTGDLKDGSNYVYIQISPEFPLEAGTYTLTGCPSGGSNQNYRLSIFKRTNNANSDEMREFGAGREVVVSEASNYILMLVFYRGVELGDLTYYPMIRLSTEDATFAPYENIRPFISYDSVSITKSGKNLIPFPYDSGIANPYTKNGITYTVNTDGTILASGTATDTSGYTNFPVYRGIYTSSKTMFSLPAGSYKLVLKGSNDTNRLYAVLYERVSDNSYETVASTRNAEYAEFTTTKASDKYYISIALRATYAPNETLQLMIVPADVEDLTYETYKGENYSISLGDTYYQGSINWNTGEMTVGMESIALTGNENWEFYSLTVGAIHRTLLPSTPNVDGNVVSDRYMGTINATRQAYSTYIQNGKNIDIIDSRYMDNDSWKAYLAEQYNAGTPVRVVYELANPVKIQLNTSFNIKALQGINTITSGPYFSNIVDFNRDSYAPNATSKMDKENPSGTGSFSMNRNQSGDIGVNSATLGSNNVASGENSLAIGSYTQASGQCSFAEGLSSKSIGAFSHAEGAQTKAQGAYSHAEGYYTIAGDFQHVEGMYNVEDTTSIHIIGNGFGNNDRSNAYTLDQSGNAWFAGDVYVGSTNGINKDSGSKKLATEDFVNSLLQNSQSSNITYSTVDLIAGESPLAEGEVYLVYE